MPTPTAPAKPIGPQGPNNAEDQDLTKVDVNDPKVNPVLKLQAMAAKAKNPGAFAKAQAGQAAARPGAQGQGTMGGAGMKGIGEKPFSLVSKNDPNGEVHIYAKNAQDAKNKYQQLGNPLGSLVDAEEVAEGRGGIDDEANLFYIYKDGRVKQRMIDNHEERYARREGYRDSPEQALRLHNIIRSKFNPNKWVQKQGDKWVEVHPFGKPEVKEGAPELLKAEMPLVRHIEQELTKIGYKKGTPEFNAYFNDAIKFYRQFGNFGFNKNQGVAEGFWDSVADKGYEDLGWKKPKKARTLDLDKEQDSPFSNYRKSWTMNNKKFGMGADEHKQFDKSEEKANPEEKPKAVRRDGKQPFHVFTLKDRKGDTVIMATDVNAAKAEWKRKYGMTGDRIIDVKTAEEANIGESMTTTTTLKTTFEGLEDTIAGLLEEYGLENGRDFYIDGTIRTVSEQVAQDILSVLSDFELPGQTNMRKLDEQYNISLIGQGEEPVDSLRIGSDSVEIKHIGEGFVRVYVNNELAETFDNGTAAFKYVKALQENLAEAEQELLSAMTAEAGEDLMKISNITEGWDDMMKAVKDRNGPQPNGGSGVKKGKRYGGADQNDDEKEEAPKDADGNPVKRGRGRPKKVREGLDSIRKMRKQVAEALARIERLPEDQRNSVRVQSVVQALEESVRTAIKKAM